MAFLPRSFDLSQPVKTLPEGSTSNLVSVRPTNGGVFNAQAVIECDIPTIGWMDPKSLGFRYKVTTTVATNNQAMIGVPAYTPFNRIQTTCNGQNLDTIQQYNQVASVLVTGQYSIGGKYGLQAGFGYTVPLDASGNFTTGNMEYLDGRTDISGNPTWTVSAPLIGTVLSNSEKMIPLWGIGSLKMSITLDSIANMFMVGASTVSSPALNLPSAFAITNFELFYQNINLGASVERMVADMGRQLNIKSHGMNNSAIFIASGANSSQSYVFNQRYSSIRSAYVCANRADGSGNKWNEIVDLTTSAGDVQLQIANVAYPALPLSTSLNEAGIMSSTRSAFGSIYDSNNCMSINSVEFYKNINDAASTLSFQCPGKHIVGIPLSRISATDKDVMLSGVSTQNSPISCIYNLNTATSVNANLNLLLDYDCVLVFDPQARQLSVRS
jgi:hypothetical protein